MALYITNVAPQFWTDWLIGHFRSGHDCGWDRLVTSCCSVFGRGLTRRTLSRLLCIRTLLTLALKLSLMKGNRRIGKIPISFDVRSLYTNIDVDEAISTTLDYAQWYDLDCYSLTLADIRELLELTLKNNVFQYNSQTFLQIRGLAMG